MRLELVIILLLITLAGCARQAEEVCLKEKCFSVELAKTSAEQAKGLMFRENLSIDKGMLFIFEKEEIYPFWMKNTLIPLDIIWIDKDKQIVFISKNTAPCDESSCNPINPGKTALYVLEINGGLSDAINLSVGQKLDFHLNKNE